ncbi:uroporphyrinogen decarboxylase family protein [Natranaerofaba carboxydovora]|uniref:uroporphyrinogen decarboxylase family protein n=1 Tax=Natranaerofaba carboxydovora TaxID=2742683 RepID=UPI001F13BFFF|nr:uroporphyrinogen decarboxylase family protein [Natranaerofaba carboxydovora]UMZ74759.1 Uroporphyrinogen decarboxylase (URO-D) [Natranaerofaba carboxydovora]
MTEDLKKLYNERLGRYQNAIALKSIDRIPIASGSNYFAEVYSGCTKQEIIYDPEKWLQAEKDFIKDFPEVDVLRNNRLWAPLQDTVGSKTYKFPGRELDPDIQFQFIEEEYMKADEYDDLINNPGEYLIDKVLPRMFTEMEDRGSPRSYMAWLKAGMAQMKMGEIMKNRSITLQQECGMPQPMTGAFLAPFDALSDALRGLQGISIDMYRQPEKVEKACEVLTEEMAGFALSTADPFKRYPIFVPTHKACFLSPKQFERFYWPSFKRVLEILIEAGYTVRAYLEGDWTQHWHHLRELPKGKVLLDIDDQADIVKAKEDLAGYQCIAGGIPSSMFILGSPDEMRERVKWLCETVGQDGGYILNGGCNIPYDTKPENYKAMIEAAMEYGFYDESLKPEPITPPEGKNTLTKKRILTPWETKKEELGGITGDEELIKEPWEMLEKMGYNWLWQWLM